MLLALFFWLPLASWAGDSDELARLKSENLTLSKALLTLDQEYRQRGELLTELQAELTATRNDLKQSRQNLQESEAILTDVQSDLQTSINELSQTKQELEMLQAKLRTLSQSLAAILAENKWLKGGLGLAIIGNIGQGIAWSLKGR
jgi:chromosome segregation ATPase